MRFTCLWEKSVTSLSTSLVFSGPLLVAGLLFLVPLLLRDKTQGDIFGVVVKTMYRQIGFEIVGFI